MVIGVEKTPEKKWSWVPGVYHQLDRVTGACLTEGCSGRTPGETGLEHLLRTAEWHGFGAWESREPAVET